jgi:hypothetical protein
MCCIRRVSLHHSDRVSERSCFSILGVWFVVICCKLRVSLHHSDPVSERSCSTLLELWFVLGCCDSLRKRCGGLHYSDCVSERVCSSNSGTLVCCDLWLGLLSFVATNLSASTIVILFPNAHVPASSRSGLWPFVVNVVSAFWCKHLVSLHRSDPVSKRFCAKVLGFWFVLL